MSKRSLITRRAVMLALGAAPFAAVPAFAQRKTAAAPDFTVEELMKVGDLPDQIVGAATAKITVVEYASTTCPACANFHRKVFPVIKAKYIETGKVRFVLREYARDDLDSAAWMLSRCAGGGDTAKSYDMAGILFDKQDEWAFQRSNPIPKLFEIAKQAGFTQETFDKCLRDEKLLAQIEAVRERGATKFGVNVTPTFFINGKRLNEASTVDAFERAFEPLLKAS